MPRRRLAFTANAGQPGATINAAWLRLLPGPGVVGLSALFVYGMWSGIVNRRWGMLGLLAFIAVQALVAPSPTPGPAAARCCCGPPTGTLPA